MGAYTGTLERPGATLMSAPTRGRLWVGTKTAGLRVYPLIPPIIARHSNATVHSHLPLSHSLTLYKCCKVFGRDFPATPLEEEPKVAGGITRRRGAIKHQKIYEVKGHKFIEKFFRQPTFCAFCKEFLWCVYTMYICLPPGPCHTVAHIGPPYIRAFKPFL